jgi:hypothetical protein
MQRHNIYKKQIFSDTKVTNIIQEDFENVVEDSGVTVSYTHFDSDFGHYVASTTMNCFLYPEETKDESGGLVSDMKFTAIFSSRSFIDSTGNIIYEPSEKDKVTYNGDVYYVTEIFYYDIGNSLTTKLKNSLVVSATITKRSSFTRSDLF